MKPVRQPSWSIASTEAAVEDLRQVVADIATAINSDEDIRAICVTALDGPGGAGGGGATPHNLLGTPTHQDTVSQGPNLGSLIKGNASSLWDELLPGAAELPLHVNTGGSDVEYSVLKVGGGGTGLTGLTANDIIYASSASTFGTIASNATATKKFLHTVSSGAPSYLQVAWPDLDLSSSDLADLATRDHGDLTSVTANQHHNQVHALIHSDHPESGLTVGHVVQATGATSYAFQGMRLHDPTDASWADGLFGWTSGSTTVMDALDEINEALAFLAPATPVSLAGTGLLNSGFVGYSGRAADGGTNYKTGAGETYTSRIFTRADAIFTLISYYVSAKYSGGDDTFSDADSGVLYAFINGVQSGGIDIGSAFNESERAGMQSYPPVTYLNLTIQEVGAYNTFPLWQRGEGWINLAQVDHREGYNYYMLRHNPGSGNRDSNLWEAYYDNSGSGTTPTVPTFTTGAALTENTATPKYLSGILFYELGDSFLLTAAMSQLFANTYSTNACTYGSVSGSTASGQVDVDPPASEWNGTVSDPPDRTDTPNLGGGATKKTLSVNVSNKASLDARITVTLNQPGRSAVNSQSASENRLVNTYGSVSTDDTERYLDEDYRLPSSFDFDDKTTGMPATSQWDETAVLTTGNAQSYQDGSGDSTGANKGALIYPQHDFTSGYLPVQGGSTDYSGFTGNQRHWRAYLSGSTPKSNVVLRIYGLGTSDLAAEGTDDKVAISFRLPTQTAWADAVAAFDSGDPTPLQTDGEGARDEPLRTGSDSNGSFVDIPCTFGGYSTADSGYRIYVRVTFTSSGAPSSTQKARKITRMEARDHGSGSTGSLW